MRAQSKVLVAEAITAADDVNGGFRCGEVGREGRRGMLPVWTGTGTLVYVRVCAKGRVADQRVAVSIIDRVGGNLQRVGGRRVAR